MAAPTAVSDFGVEVQAAAGVVRRDRRCSGLTTSMISQSWKQSVTFLAAERHRQGQGQLLYKLKRWPVHAVLSLMHTYYVFVAIIIVVAVCLHVLVAWCSVWLQQVIVINTKPGRISTVWYVGLLLRCFLMIRLMSELARSAVWMLYDSWRLQAFILYRRTLTGDAFSFMCDGHESVAERLSKDYRPNERQWWLDLAVQIFLYFTLDLVPFLWAGINCAMYGKWSEFFVRFRRTVFASACFHVLLFHAAWIISDVAAKKATLCLACKRRDNPTRELSNIFELSGWRSEASGYTSRTSTFLPMETDRFSVLSGKLVFLHPPEVAPANLWILMARVGATRPWRALMTCIWVGVGVIGAALRAPRTCLVGLILGVPFWRHYFAFCSDRVSADLERRAGERSSSNRLRVGETQWMQSIQGWASSQCGLSKQALAPNFEILFAVQVAYIALYYKISWYDGALIGAGAATYVAGRRITLRRLQNCGYGWLVGLCEGFVHILLVIILSTERVDMALSLLLLALGSQFTFARFDSYKVQTCRLLTSFFHLCLVIVLVICIAAARAPAQDEDSQVRDLESETSRKLSSSGPTLAEARYSFCELRFPLGRNEGKTASFYSGLISNDFAFGHASTRAKASLSITDFANFCKLSSQRPKAFNANLHRQFPGWTKVFEHRGEHIARRDLYYTDWTTFFELVDPKNTTTVFVIRGTRSAFDWMQDVRIWLPVLVSLFAKGFGPSLTPFLQDALFFISRRLAGMDTAGYLTVLLEHVKKRVESQPNRRYYLTGHSLGGGLANLVSLAVNRVAITFSPPGVAKTAQWILAGDANEQKFFSAAPHLSYAVVPDKDPVPWLDRQIGTIFKLGCSKSWTECHKLRTTLAELTRVCGDT